MRAAFSIANSSGTDCYLHRSEDGHHGIVQGGGITYEVNTMVRKYDALKWKSPFCKTQNGL